MHAHAKHTKPSIDNQPAFGVALQAKQDLSAAFEAAAHHWHLGAADKRYSLGISTFASAMITIQYVKTVIDEDHFLTRLDSDRRRLHAFLLCADEHTTFISAIQKSWNTLHKISGESCDIYTLERRTEILASLGSPSYPDRTQCFDVRDRLFKSPQKVILPGVLIFHSIEKGTAKYYACGGMKAADISSLFQVVFTTIATGYSQGKSRQENFNSFVQQEKIRRLKEYAMSAVMKLSLGDLVKAVSAIGQLAMPAEGNND